MTVTADTEADTGQQAVAERVRKIREAQGMGVSRAEGWRRRGPLLPALIFMIVVMAPSQAIERSGRDAPKCVY